MALVFWRAAVGGDWSTAADWSTNTVPSPADNVEFELVGNYLVTVTNAQTANSLTFNAPGAQLIESPTGKLTLNGLLTLHALVVDNGYVELDAANTITAFKLNVRRTTPLRRFTTGLPATLAKTPKVPSSGKGLIHTL